MASTGRSRRLPSALLLAALRAGARVYIRWAWARVLLEGWWSRRGLRPVFVLARILWLCARSAWQTRWPRKGANP